MTKPTYDELHTFVSAIADYVRYGDQPGRIGDMDEDALATINRTIERAREIMRLPETSAEEADRANVELLEQP